MKAESSEISNNWIIIRNCIINVLNFYTQGQTFRRLSERLVSVRFWFWNETAEVLNECLCEVPQCSSTPSTSCQSGISTGSSQHGRRSRFWETSGFPPCDGSWSRPAHVKFSSFPVQLRICRRFIRRSAERSLFQIKQLKPETGFVWRKWTTGERFSFKSFKGTGKIFNVHKTS